MESKAQQRTLLTQKIQKQLEELLKNVDKHRDFLNQLAEAAERFPNLDDQLQTMDSDISQSKADTLELKTNFSLLKEENKGFSQQLSTEVAKKFAGLDHQLETLSADLKQHQAEFQGLHRELSSCYQEIKIHRDASVNKLKNVTSLNRLVILAIILSTLSLVLSVINLMS